MAGMRPYSLPMASLLGNIGYDELVKQTRLVAERAEESWMKRHAHQPADMMQARLGVKLPQRSYHVVSPSSFED